MAQRVLIRSEQIYATARVENGFLLSGTTARVFPWGKLRGSQIYAVDRNDLEALLADAVSRGFQILDGYHSDRRALRGFTVGIGAWGHRGKVECRCADVWGVEVDSGRTPQDRVEEVQSIVRGLCVRLNTEKTPFRSSAFRWLSGLYTRLGQPLEPEGHPESLPQDVAMLCRQAHVGGPIVHARTSLEPFVTLDRKRAFGEAMLLDLPAGVAYDVPLSGSGLHRWRPHDLQRAMGVADATVRVEPGPVVPLLPLLKRDFRFDRARTIYPTGRFRGAWPLSELVHLERSGLGRVERIHRCVTFDTAPVLRDVVLYIRSIESDLMIPGKRLEHMLYGKCARGLTLTRIGTASTLKPTVPRDLLDDRSLKRIDGKVEVRPCPVNSTEKKPHHPLVKVVARMSARSERGTMDRPDRAAVITSRNRVAMSQIILALDDVLEPERSGSYVGRVYVDGIDVETTPDRIPDLVGVEVRRSGPQMRLYRSGAIFALLEDDTTCVEGAGLLPKGSTRQELETALSVIPDADGGPFASGRLWPRRGSEEDPRMLPDVGSEPPHIDSGFGTAMGFTEDFSVEP